MKKNHGYRTTQIGKVQVEKLVRGHEGESVTVGIDVAKYEHYAVAQWADGSRERPWKVGNPEGLKQLKDKLVELSQGRQVLVAIEPSGTYGDPLRALLTEAGLAVHRVSPKVTNDYEEIFDGVPSKHDGKDAAMIAELASMGKSKPWPWENGDLLRKEMTCLLNELDLLAKTKFSWLNQIEAQTARHWPELPRLLELGSVTLLKLMAKYGGPSGVAQAGELAARDMHRWSKGRLSPEKIAAVIESARSTVGARQSQAEREHMRVCAHQVRTADTAIGKLEKKLERVVKDHPVIQAQRQVVGLVTACILWADLGSPENYHCGDAYQKAMGLNLIEHSSGTYQGQLRISRRGPSRVRRWLYFAAMRWCQHEAVSPWYKSKKEREGGCGSKGLVGIMRKLACALWQVGAQGQEFDPWKLFPGQATPVVE